MTDDDTTLRQRIEAWFDDHTPSPTTSGIDIEEVGEGERLARDALPDDVLPDREDTTVTFETAAGEPMQFVEFAEYTFDKQETLHIIRELASIHDLDGVHTAAVAQAVDGGVDPAETSNAKIRFTTDAPPEYERVAGFDDPEVHISTDSPSEVEQVKYPSAPTGDDLPDDTVPVGIATTAGFLPHAETTERIALMSLRAIAEAHGYDEIRSIAFDRDLGPTTDRRDKDVHEEAAEKVASDIGDIGHIPGEDPADIADDIADEMAASLDDTDAELTPDGDVDLEGAHTPHTDDSGIEPNDVLKPVAIQFITKPESDALIDAGFDTIADLHDADYDDIFAVNAISPAKAARIKVYLDGQPPDLSDDELVDDLLDPTPDETTHGRDHDVDDRAVKLRVTVDESVYTDVVRECERSTEMPPDIDVYVQRIDAFDIDDGDVNPHRRIDEIAKNHGLTVEVRDAAVDGTRAGAFTPLDDLGSTADRERSDDETPNAFECSGCGDRPLHTADDLAWVECGHPNDGDDEKPQSPSESWDIEDLLDDDLPTGDAMAGLLLEDAHGVVTASRDTHGDAVENQQHIAQGWTWYLRGKGLLDDDQHVNGGDVGRMFPIAKMSRTAVGTYDVDHDRDVAGYAGIAAACEVDDGNADLEDLTGEAENRGS